MVAELAMVGPRSRVTFEQGVWTPEDALRIWNETWYPRQRAVRPLHVAYLREAIRRGSLTLVEVKFAELGGERKLIDGQHRLRAQHEADATLPYTAMIYHVDDEDAIQKLYETLDRPMVRGLRDMLKHLAEKLGCRLAVATRLASGAAVTQGNFIPSEYDAYMDRALPERVKALEEWLPECAIFLECLRGADKTTEAMLQRRAVVAVALATLREQPRLAVTFWSGVSSGLGLTDKSPEYRLLRWLRDNKPRVGNVHYDARTVASAWNAFWDHREITALNCMGLRTAKATKERTGVWTWPPFYLGGTKFTGRSDD